MVRAAPCAGAAVFSASSAASFVHRCAVEHAARLEAGKLLHPSGVAVFSDGTLRRQFLHLGCPAKSVFRLICERNRWMDGSRPASCENDSSAIGFVLSSTFYKRSVVILPHGHSLRLWAYRIFLFCRTFVQNCSLVTVLCSSSKIELSVSLHTSFDGSIRHERLSHSKSAKCLLRKLWRYSEIHSLYSDANMAILYNSIVVDRCENWFGVQGGCSSKSCRREEFRN